MKELSNVTRPLASRGANLRSTIVWFAAAFGSRLNFATPRIFSYAPAFSKFTPEAKDERSRTSIPITSARAATSVESPTAANPSNTRLLKIPTPLIGRSRVDEYYQAIYGSNASERVRDARPPPIDAHFIGTIVPTSLAWDDSASTNTGAER